MEYHQCKVAMRSIQMATVPKFWNKSSWAINKQVMLGYLNTNCSWKLVFNETFCTIHTKLFWYNFLNDHATITSSAIPKDNNCNQLLKDFYMPLCILHIFAAQKRNVWMRVQNVYNKTKHSQLCNFYPVIINVVHHLQKSTFESVTSHLFQNLTTFHGMTHKQLNCILHTTIQFRART